MTHKSEFKNTEFETSQARNNSLCYELKKKRDSDLEIGLSEYYDERELIDLNGKKDFFKYIRILLSVAETILL